MTDETRLSISHWGMVDFRAFDYEPGYYFHCGSKRETAHLIHLTEDETWREHVK